MLISPFKTLISCGSSSSSQFLRNLPPYTIFNNSNDHGAELPGLEYPAIQPYPLLPEEHRALGIQLYEKGCKGQKRLKDQKADYRYHHIENPLGEHLSRLTRSHRGQ
jgi:hypothetical protein